MLKNLVTLFATRDRVTCSAKILTVASTPLSSHNNIEARFIPFAPIAVVLYSSRA